MGASATPRLLKKEDGLMKLNVPNILTVIRFLLIGVFVYLFQVPKNYVAAVIVFAVAALTDVLDGYIARKYNQVTDFGKLFDPLADKLMLFAALICLTLAGYLSPIFLIFVFVKDIILIIGSAFLYKKEVVVYAKIWGKLATLFFNGGVGLTIIGIFVPWIAPWHEVVLGIAVVFGVLAGVQYGKVFFESRKEIRAREEGQDGRQENGSGSDSH